MKQDEEELWKTFMQMQKLLDKAKELAEPILKRGDEEERKSEPPK